MILHKKELMNLSLLFLFCPYSFFSRLIFLTQFSNCNYKTNYRFLQKAIHEISLKHYSYRIHIDNKDEFGKLANAFNEMAERLQYFESSNLNKLMFEKSRAEAVINSLKDASIGLDKNNIILFANAQALQLLNLSNENIIGIEAGIIAEQNDLFKFFTRTQPNFSF